VRAEVDVLLPLHQFGDELCDVRIHERLAPRDGHDGSPALVDGLEALLDCELLPEDLAWVLDLAATRAGKVAAEQRLEHDEERILAPPTKALREHVAGDGPHLGQGYAHGLRLSGCQTGSPARAGARSVSARDRTEHTTATASGAWRRIPTQSSAG